MLPRTLSTRTLPEPRAGRVATHVTVPRTSATHALDLQFVVLPTKENASVQFSYRGDTPVSLLPYFGIAPVALPTGTSQPWVCGPLFPFRVTRRSVIAMSAAKQARDEHGRVNHAIVYHGWIGCSDTAISSASVKPSPR